MPPIDRVNKHGAPLCHAYRCRRHKRLFEGFNGLFCERHYDELLAIRMNLIKAKQDKDLVAENEWRQREIEFRKFAHEGHMFYKLHVERRLEYVKGVL